MESNLGKRISVNIRIRDPTSIIKPVWSVEKGILYQQLEKGKLAYSCYQNVFHNCRNYILYEKSIRKSIDELWRGVNCTIFAYGQTGSGKTHTMSGTPDEIGIIQHSLRDIFDSAGSGDTQIEVSYLEIYNESIADLINDGQKVQIFGSGDTTTVNNLLKQRVVCESEALAILEKCNERRQTSTTEYNARSSRSHTVFQVHITRDSISACLSLIDLAGSERAAESMDRRKEGGYINKSLLALGTVINSIVKNEHVNYRNSKLTRLLQQSLDGNCNIVSLCMIAPEKEFVVESVTTLKFAARLSQVELKERSERIIYDNLPKATCPCCGCDKTIFNDDRNNGKYEDVNGTQNESKIENEAMRDIKKEIWRQSSLTLNQNSFLEAQTFQQDNIETISQSKLYEILKRIPKKEFIAFLSLLNAEILLKSKEPDHYLEENTQKVSQRETCITNNNIIEYKQNKEVVSVERPNNKNYPEILQNKEENKPEIPQKTEIKSFDIFKKNDLTTKQSKNLEFSEKEVLELNIMASEQTVVDLDSLKNQNEKDLSTEKHLNNDVNPLKNQNGKDLSTKKHLNNDVNPKIPSIDQKEFDFSVSDENNKESFLEKKSKDQNIEKLVLQSSENIKYQENSDKNSLESSLSIEKSENRNSSSISTNNSDKISFKNHEILSELSKNTLQNLKMNNYSTENFVDINKTSNNSEIFQDKGILEMNSNNENINKSKFHDKINDDTIKNLINKGSSYHENILENVLRLRNQTSLSGENDNNTVVKSINTAYQENYKNNNNSNIYLTLNSEKKQSKGVTTEEIDMNSKTGLNQDCEAKITHSVNSKFSDSNSSEISPKIQFEKDSENHKNLGSSLDSLNENVSKKTINSDNVDSSDICDLFTKNLSIKSELSLIKESKEYFKNPEKYEELKTEKKSVSNSENSLNLKIKKQEEILKSKKKDDVWKTKMGLKLLKKNEQLISALKEVEFLRKELEYINEKNFIFSERIKCLEETIYNLSESNPSKRISKIYLLEKNMFNLQLEMIKRERK